MFLSDAADRSRLAGGREKHLQNLGARTVRSDHVRGQTPVMAREDVSPADVAPLAPPWS